MCENICSEPDAGLVLPATLIATPETIIAFTPSQAESSVPVLISSTLSIRS
jgi:hypothetical protein